MDEIKDGREDLQKKVEKKASHFKEAMDQLDSATLHKITRIDPNMFEDEDEATGSIIDEELLKE